MANTVYDIVQIREVEGRDKPIYTNIGILIEKDGGKRSIKLNAIPVDWDGWAQVFEKREREDKEPF